MSAVNEPGLYEDETGTSSAKGPTEQRMRVVIKDGGSGSGGTREVFNVSLGVVNTEQSLTLPIGTVKYLIKSRGNSLLKLTWTTGESGTKFVTIPKNAVLEDDKSASGLTLYFQSPQTGDIIEVVTWS